jgi:hypothetical protein
LLQPQGRKRPRLAQPGPWFLSREGCNLLLQATDIKGLIMYFVVGWQC